MIYDNGGARFMMTVLRICGEPFAFTKAPTPECRRRLELGLSRYLRKQEDIARRCSLTEQIAEANRRAQGKE